MQILKKKSLELKVIILKIKHKINIYIKKIVILIFLDL